MKKKHGEFLNRGLLAFDEFANFPLYVDKTDMIAELNAMVKQY